MNNLYLIFANEQERRNFVLELMGLKVYIAEENKTVWNIPMLFNG